MTHLEDDLAGIRNTLLVERLDFATGTFDTRWSVQVFALSHALRTGVEAGIISPYEVAQIREAASLREKEALVSELTERLTERGAW